MNLKDFAKTDVKKGTNQEKISESDLHKINEDYGDLIQEFLKRYGQMNEGEMLSELFKLIEQKKADGTFNPDEIKKVAIHIAPFLDESQKEYMNNLLKYLD